MLLKRLFCSSRLEAFLLHIQQENSPTRLTHLLEQYPALPLPPGDKQRVLQAFIHKTHHFKAFQNSSHLPLEQTLCQILSTAPCPDHLTHIF